MSVATTISAKIQAALPKAQVTVEDPMQDDTHLRAVVVSADFAGKPRIERHRMVYAALGDAFSQELHALQMILRAPDEV